MLNKETQEEITDLEPSGTIGTYSFCPECVSMTLQDHSLLNTDTFLSKIKNYKVFLRDKNTLYHLFHCLSCQAQWSIEDC